MELHELQAQMRRLYGTRDEMRGVDATFRWLTEEVGELAKAIRLGDRASLIHEFGDVLAWLASLANMEGVELDESAGRYRDGCPRCGLTPCGCPF
jgi:NTP pyrophosphatase (non-canonical NTP hydrolase)